MALIDEVKMACKRLAGGHWTELMAKHGLDITANDLAAELAKPLTKIDRTIPGFEDFALAGKRGIEPGKPALSLLYHAFASPAVTRLDSKPITKGGVLLALFPTLLEIESVENYVFGVKPPTLAELESRLFGRGGLPIHSWGAVVFSCEYRPAVATTHRKHADLVFSRAGISHVGPAAAHYDDRLRAFTQPPVVHHIPPKPPDTSHAVTPARFVVYLALKTKGSIDHAIPMNANQEFEFGTPHDTDTDFWLPVHKLFNGPECLAHGTVNVSWSAGHLNEKLRRMHLWLQSYNIPTGQDASVLNQSPFTFTEGIAELSPGSTWPPGWVVPKVHPRFIEPATRNGAPLTYLVPGANTTPSLGLFNPTMSGSLRLDHLAQSIGGSNAFPDAPDIVHARTKVVGTQVIDLNAEGDTDSVVHDGNYYAQHYVDYTGDGWVGASWSLTNSPGGTHQARSAYSIVGAPDCLPECSEREIWEWCNTFAADSDITSVGDSLIWDKSPTPLSHERIAANVQLKDAGFSATDLTMTAIVPLYGSWPGNDPQPPSTPAVSRPSYLPDASSGREEPGWDIGRAVLGSGPTAVYHLAAHTLGSPFLEDAKLCAALSAYWPAVGPDVARRYGDRHDAVDGTMVNLIPAYVNRSVVPLTDAELGVGGVQSWDGDFGPSIFNGTAANYYVLPRFDQGDYVKAALAGKWWPGGLHAISSAEYQRRALGMVRVYRRLVSLKKAGSAMDFLTAARMFLVISFRNQPDAAELTQAQSETGKTLAGTPLRYEMADHLLGVWGDQGWSMELQNRITFYVDPENNVVLGKKFHLPWQVMPEL